jgi:tetratricopeptide (TPR) repeat protein
MLGYFYFQSIGTEDMTAIAEAKKSFPDDVALHIAFGSLSETSGWMRHDADALDIAEIQYRIVLDADPDHTEALIRLGRVLTLTGQTKEAFDILSRGLETARDPKLQLAGLLSLGEVLLERGELDEAIETFRTALSLDPICQTSVMALAMALHKTGDTQGSRQVVHEYLLPETKRSPSRASSGKQDLWWRYLLSNADHYESLREELREEIRL